MRNPISNFRTRTMTPNPQNLPSVQLVKVLMAEDDDLYFRFVEKILVRQSRDIKFDLVRASDLSSTLERLTRAAPDVILLDLNLPDSQGLDTLTKINEKSGTKPIIILTGRDDENVGIQSLARGAHEYLVKQRISNDSLVRAIRYTIERRKSELARLRLAAIKDFTSALAHDLQVPLVGSRNLLDAILGDQLGPVSDPQREALVELRKSNEDQIRLIQKLLEIYRYESQGSDLSFGSTPVHAIISQCLEKLSPMIRNHGIEMETSFAPDLHCVWGDKTTLDRVFINLLENGIKFGGPEKKIRVAATNVEDGVLIAVKSFGETISLEDQRLLFQGFWQGVPGKKYVASTGLGLYLCHHIVSLHGGNITCESSEENGTIFSVTLPAAYAPK